MDIVITVKVQRPTTTVSLKRPLTGVKEVELLSVQGIDGPCLILCDLIKPNRSFDNLGETFPTENVSLRQSSLLAVFPSNKYPSVSIKKSSNPTDSFSLSCLNLNGSGPLFKEPAVISLRMITTEQKEK